jgi:hypothetical protein
VQALELLHRGVGDALGVALAAQADRPGDEPEDALEASRRLRRGELVRHGQDEHGAAALDAHVEGLKGIDGTEVGKLREQLTKTAEHWKKAANAADADAFYIAYDPAFTGIDPNKTVAARKELHLATTVPADDAEAWSS